MDLKEIEKHWNQWANQYGKDIRATDKSRTRKALETDSLVRTIKSAGFSETSEFTILEPGCGTGHNCLSIAEFFPKAKVYGFDYVKSMVTNAKELQSQTGIKNIEYFEGDLLAMEKTQLPVSKFDVIFTNRCIINLNTHELQAQALKNLTKLVANGGCLILGENPQNKFDKQNELRAIIDLPAREVPSFNVLINEKNVIETLTSCGFELTSTDDFSALHDLLLYVLIPKTNGGTIDYDHPMLEVVKELCPPIFKNTPNAFGHYGQNRMYLFRKK